MAFTIDRGTNISNWLSQSKRRGQERERFFAEDDVKRIADWGFDHIRLPVDEEQLWDIAGAEEPEAWKLLESALDWSERAGLRVVVDLHLLRSHHFLEKVEPRLFTDPAETARFANLWRQMSTRLRGRDTDRVAYELMNEPVAHTAANWNRVAMAALAAIREVEPARTIVLGSNHFNSPFWFDRLHVPADARLILTFHYYIPMAITHYGAQWTELRAYSGPVNYPGLPIDPAEIEKVREPERAVLRSWNKPCDAGAMEQDIVQPLAAARRTGLGLYCGEFGAIRRAPEAARQAWYRDLLGVFRKHHIAWANWDYCGGFAPLWFEGRSTGLAELMLGG
jgi:endoglucanase